MMDSLSSLVLVVLTLQAAVSSCSSLDLSEQPSNRRLLQDRNPDLLHRDHLPSVGSSTFPRSDQPRNDANGTPHSSSSSSSQSHEVHAKKESSKKGSKKWLYTVVIPVAAGVLLAGIAWMFSPCRKRSDATIGPWKTGLSGQLQKAFVSGVPQLQRSELERACEDFSNIVASHPYYTVYKGTLSSGVEIAVVSTTIKSSKDWSKHGEDCFRKKIDSLSRINHKNFINLLGFCEEEDPFTRVMVLEYAPNGTLYENLHDESFDHIDWRSRMRIIMGVAYCIQHMHELSPAKVHPDLHSSAMFLSEDSAAKIADLSVWQEVVSEGKMPRTNGDHQEPISAGLAGNVYSFGILLLEIISGKLPYSENEGSLVNLALGCIIKGRSIASLLDPKLESHKENELDLICQIILDCIQSDPKKRPSMREITTRLREAIAISPDAATPRLSPLWWAELEVLSPVEAT
ncbi:protein MALE DISCOVERER 2-like [Oryza brachyantha]|uniref:Protein kinase domain-containing protein n=1 Tax=Oryza brachyantha TaxID=4533 RepID=J3M9P1_ORYBR|nr:protein MALE DISCOVERER 2-like [Oryza brachyantha]XP_015692424.1 protein MALE DISCOVERER 2-like [Oryza brachyantha]